MLEKRGMKVCRSNMEYMCVNEREGTRVKTLGFNCKETRTGGTVKYTEKSVWSRTCLSAAKK